MNLNIIAFVLRHKHPYFVNKLYKWECITYSPLPFLLEREEEPSFSNHGINCIFVPGGSGSVIPCICFPNKTISFR